MSADRGRLRLLHLHSSFDRGGKELRAVKLMNLFGTGIGIGDGVQFASYPQFERIGAVEIRPDIAATVRERFEGDDRVRILNESSGQAPANVLPGV